MNMLRPLTSYLSRHHRLLAFAGYLLFLSACGTTTKTTRPVASGQTGHTVVKGENIGRIANTYNLTEEDFRKANPGVDLKRLRPGQVLKIPHIEKSAGVQWKEEKKAVVAERKRTTTKMALLLPLNAAQINSGNLTDLEITMDQSVIPYLHFYLGVKTALDSLAQGGNHFTLTLLDSGSDSLKLARLIRDSLFVKNDLVIGVSSGSWISQLTAASLKFQKPLVIAQHNTAAFLEGNRQLILTTPSVALQCQLMSNFLYSHFKQEKMLLLHQDSKKENDLAALFGTGIEIQHLKEGRRDSLKIKNLVYDSKNFEQVSRQFDKTKKNVIVLTSSDEAFVSPIITRLDSLDEYKFVVCGLPTWENFETIDPQRLQNLETHIFTSSYVDYNQGTVRNFRKTFLEQTKADPQYLAYLGFSIAWLTGSILEQGSGDLIRGIENARQHTLPLKFDFKSKTPQDGLENHHITILKFENFSLLPVE